MKLEQESDLARTSGPRQEPFAYTCQRCSRCCHHKTIQLNPYEVARLARRLGQTTTEFRIAWTVESAGTMLKQTDAGACVFLGEKGCTVHSDRPLVCRLYPLARFIDSDGVEWFSRVEPHPQSAGKVTDAGTIAEFIENQGAAPFIAAADSYFSWLCAAIDWVGAEANTPSLEHSIRDVAAATTLLDMDMAIDRQCTSIEISQLKDIDDRMRCHLDILYREINPSERSTPP